MILGLSPCRFIETRSEWLLLELPFGEVWQWVNNPIEINAMIIFISCILIKSKMANLYYAQFYFILITFYCFTKLIDPIYCLFGFETTFWFWDNSAPYQGPSKLVVNFPENAFQDLPTVFEKVHIKNLFASTDQIINRANRFISQFFSQLNPLIRGFGLVAHISAH